MTPTLPPGLTRALVDHSTRRSIQKLSEASKMIDTALNMETKQIIAMASSPVVKTQRLHSIVRLVAKEVAKVSACHKGCSHCCHMACAINSDEAARIGEFTGISPAQIARYDISTERDALVAKYMNVPCPFLKDGECSVYEVRPVACRTHFNLSAYPQVCDTYNYPGNDVPNLNWSPVWMADVMINFHTASYADIREFFPTIAVNCTEVSNGSAV